MKQKVYVAELYAPPFWPYVHMDLPPNMAERGSIFLIYGSSDLEKKS